MAASASSSGRSGASVFGAAVGRSKSKIIGLAAAFDENNTLTAISFGIYGASRRSLVAVDEPDMN